MKKWNNIIVYFLLSLYGCVFLHSIIPHSHHSSSKIDVEFITQDKEEASWLDLFDDLVHNHEHQYDTEDFYDEYTNESETIDKLIENPVDHFFISEAIYSEDLKIISSNKISFIYVIPLSEKSVQTRHLRGPPANIS